MSNNSGSCKIVKFNPIKKVDDNMQNFAEEFFDVISIDYTDDGLEQLIGYIDVNANETDMTGIAENQGVALPPFVVEEISSNDWLTENVIKFQPVSIDNFIVYGVHEKNINLQGKIGVKVYAATAFGSEHQTTKSCLHGISDVYKLTKNINKILDVGTGSGVLAIAAAKLWPDAKVIAVDIDKEAVNVARQNSIDNAVERQITTSISDGYKADIVKNNTPYDLILANILARPLIEMAEDMSKNLKTGGYAIISGFIDNQSDWVIEAHEKNNLKLLHVYKDENWRAALLERIK